MVKLLPLEALCTQPPIYRVAPLPEKEITADEFSRWHRTVVLFTPGNQKVWPIDAYGFGFDCWYAKGKDDGEKEIQE